MAAVSTTSRLFTRISSRIASAAGRPITFGACCAAIIGWAISGPLFGFSETWQLIVNTATTIITFLMVFLIQNTQNRDGAALQAKLDELIRASEAHNQFIGIERLTDEELTEILIRCEADAKEADQEFQRVDQIRAPAKAAGERGVARFVRPG